MLALAANLTPPYHQRYLWSSWQPSIPYSNKLSFTSYSFFQRRSLHQIWENKAQLIGTEFCYQQDKLGNGEQLSIKHNTPLLATLLEQGGNLISNRYWVLWRRSCRVDWGREGGVSQSSTPSPRNVFRSNLFSRGQNKTFGNLLLSSYIPSMVPIRDIQLYQRHRSFLLLPVMTPPPQNMVVSHHPLPSYTPNS